MPCTCACTYVCQCSEVVEPSEDAEGAGSGGRPSAGAEVGGVRLWQL